METSGYLQTNKESFPALISRGVSEEEIHQITQENPVRAFSLPLLG